MVTGPVLGKFTREVAKIHNSKNKMNPKCELTYTVCKKIIIVVDNQLGREKVHYLFITPPDFYVDNQIFGKHVTDMEPFWNDMSKGHPAHNSRTYTGTQVSW
eukprot:5899379-Ditylum_brightwellii.AAC.1